MARKQEKPGKISFTSPDDSSLARLKGFIVTSIILIIIVMVFGAVAVRTESGRRQIEKRAGKYAGTPVTVDAASIGFPYMLVLDGLSTVDFDITAETGFRIEEVRIGLVRWLLMRPIPVKVSGCTVFLVQDADEQWGPGAFARMGDLPLGNISEVTKLTLKLRDRVNLTVTDGAIRWKSTAGVGALAKKIEFEMSRIKMPGQVMYYYCLSVLNVLGADGVRLHDVKREWLASEKDSYIEIARSDDTAEKSEIDFWEDDGGRGDSK